MTAARVLEELPSFLARQEHVELFHLEEHTVRRPSKARGGNARRFPMHTEFSVYAGAIISPPCSSGVYCALVDVLDDGQPVFYVGKASHFWDRLTSRHHRWHQIERARALFVAIEDRSDHRGDLVVWMEHIEYHMRYRVGRTTNGPVYANSGHLVPEARGLADRFCHLARTVLL